LDSEEVFDAFGNLEKLLITCDFYALLFKIIDGGFKLRNPLFDFVFLFF
jgi:hypothetical protein